MTDDDPDLRDNEVHSDDPWQPLEEIYFDGPEDKRDSNRPIEEPAASSIDKDREWVRKFLAIGLALLLASIVLTALIATICGVNDKQLDGTLNTVLPPVVALAGSAIGFYYADRRN